MTATPSAIPERPFVPETRADAAAPDGACGDGAPACDTAGFLGGSELTGRLLDRPSSLTTVITQSSPGTVPIPVTRYAFETSSIRPVAALVWRRRDVAVLRSDESEHRPQQRRRFGVLTPAAEIATILSAIPVVVGLVVAGLALLQPDDTPDSGQDVGAPAATSSVAQPAPTPALTFLNRLEPERGRHYL